MKIEQRMREQLVELRQRAGLSVEASARMVYVSPRAWQRWEKGERNVPMASLELFSLKVGNHCRPEELRMEWTERANLTHGEVRLDFGEVIVEQTPEEWWVTIPASAEVLAGIFERRIWNLNLLESGMSGRCFPSGAWSSSDDWIRCRGTGLLAQPHPDRS